MTLHVATELDALCAHLNTIPRVTAEVVPGLEPHRCQACNDFLCVGDSEVSWQPISTRRRAPLVSKWVHHDHLDPGVLATFVVPVAVGNVHVRIGGHRG